MCTFSVGPFSSDLLRAALLVAMSVSGAFLLSCGLNMWGDLVSESEHEMGGYITSVFLVNGISAGGILGYCFEKCLVYLM